MLFFKSFRSGKKKATSPGQSFRPLLEAFESRDLPSAGGFFAAHHFALADLAGSAAASSGSTAASSGTQSTDPCQGAAQTQTLTATLTGTTGSGTATFTSDTTDATNNLNVKVSGLSASTTYTVMFGTTSLGTITTDSSGAGQLSTSNLSPALTSGATITVVDPSGVTALSGTLASAATGTSNTNLKASLTGATGTSGHANFFANATTGDNEFKLAVSGLTASSTYTVQVDGTTVGQLTTDTSGSGKLSVSDLTQTVAAGSVVTVLDSTGATVLQGTFASASGAHGWRHH